MFKGMVGDITGGADVCTCLTREQFMAEPCMQYVLADETVFIYLRAAKLQYIFTDQALIVSAGSSGASTKRLVSRFEYNQYDIVNVGFETAGFGLTDLDCELKFQIGGQNVSIDIEKRQTEIAVHYYRCLTDLARTQHHNAFRLKTLLSTSIQRAPKLTITDGGLESKLAALSADCIQFTEAALIKYKPESYKEVFLRHFPSA
jgi:hypothetical protein